MSDYNFTTARFHIETGPKVLFDRVRYIMKDVSTLHISGPHFQQRVSERQVPSEIIEMMQNFNCNQWSLVEAEVRTDKGKFVNSTWEIIYDQKRYWITIGFGGTVSTIVIKQGSGLGKVVKWGDFYNKVRDVNTALMIEDVPEYGKQYE